ncbi:unnamed protein product [Rhodiola kirilowii]
MLNPSNPKLLHHILSINQTPFRRLHQDSIFSNPSPSSSLPPPSHDHIARLILDQKSAAQSLQTFRWASMLPNFTHSQSTYRALIHKLCAFRRFEDAHNLLDEMPDTIGSVPDEDVFVTIVRGLGRAKMIKRVTLVPDLVKKFGKKPSLKLLNSILDVLVMEDIDLARGFFRKKMMNCGVQGDAYTYGILMKGLCLTNRIGDGFKLLQAMKSRGLVPNVVVYNTLLHVLCKNGKVGRARSLMKEVAEPNGVTFNTLITAYCHEENLIQALVMLEKSFNLGYVPDVITVTNVLKVLCKEGRASEGRELLERVEDMGGKVDVVAYNTVIEGFCKLRKVKIGCLLLKDMERKGCLPNADTYNVLISGYLDVGMLDSATEMFYDMKTDGIIWNFATYDMLIRGLCAGGRINDGLKILELMEESKGGAQGRISPYNSVIYGLYKEDRLNEALDFLVDLGKLFPRAIDRSLMIISFCEKKRVEDAKRIYDQMVNEGDVPCAIVYAILIHLLSQEGLVREAFELLNGMIDQGYFPIVPTFNVVTTALCHQGRVNSAMKLLDDIVVRGCFPNTQSYLPLITCFTIKGEFERAAVLVGQMAEKGIPPDRHTWNAMFHDCTPEQVSVEGRNVDSVINHLLEFVDTQVVIDKE